MINIRLSFRSLIRGKLYFFLNLAGLSIAFAISFFIISYILREYSINRHFTNYNRIARVLTVKKTFGWTEPSASYPLHLALKKNIPGIEAATPLRRFRSFLIENDKDDLRVRSAYAASSDFFKVFTPDIIFGDPTQFFEDPNSVVITRSLAERISGELPAQGANLIVSLGSNRINMTVGGLIEDFPETSSIRPELIGSVDLLKYEFPEGSFYGDYSDAWQKDLFSEFILIRPDADLDDIVSAMSLFSSEMPEGYDYLFTLQPMKRLHLFSTDYVNDGGKGDIKFVILFGAVGILILIIAISNYIILSIGSSNRRIPEISIRKIFGARTSAIRFYVLMESISICLLSVPAAYLITIFSSEAVEELFNIDMQLVGEEKFILFILVALLVIFTGILSGAYLASKLGNTSPLEVLGVKSAGGRGRSLYKILITVQIIIFVSLLSSAFIVLRQLNYSKNIDPGFNSENLIIGEFPSGIISDFEAFRYELQKNPNIIDLSFGAVLPPTQSAMVSVMRPPDGGQEISFEGVSADFNFINTSGIEIIAGRGFDKNLASDSSAMLINETLALNLGIDGNTFDAFERLPNIIGIVKDFQIHSIREDIPPLTIQISKPRYISSFMVKYRPGTMNEIIDFIEGVFKDIQAEKLSIISYEEAVSNFYGREARLGTIVSVFGTIALLVAMLGVFGLSLFLTNELRYDTAIYRVFGASSKRIVLLNLWRYLFYIGLGNIISIPLVIIFMSRWLQQFAERISIGPWVFISTFLISALVFLATTLFNTLRLAYINPAQNLRQD